MADYDPLTIRINQAIGHAATTQRTLPCNYSGLCGRCTTTAIDGAVRAYRDELAEKLADQVGFLPEPEQASYADGYDDALDFAAGIIRGAA